MSARIVVCDDENHITRAIRMKLTKSGFDVVSCSDGQFGWESIQERMPDLLITDYQMPRMDGIQLCATIRADEAARDLPIILLTAKGYELNDDTQIPALELAAIVLKPFSPRELLKLVQDILAKTGAAVG